MGNLSQSDLYSLARSTGLSETKAKTAAAIGMAESSGNPNVVNSVPCVGIWQINMAGALGVQRRAHFHLSSINDLKNPQKNAAAMYSISVHGTNWTPWETYTNGAYMKYFNNPVKGESILDVLKNWNPLNGTPAAALGTTANNLAGVTDTPTELASIAGTFGNISNAVQHGSAWISNWRNWVRIGLVVGGGVGLAMFVGAMARETPAGAAVVSGAEKVAGAGMGVATDGASVVAGKAASAVKKAAPVRRASATVKAHGASKQWFGEGVTA